MRSRANVSLLMSVEFDHVYTRAVDNVPESELKQLRQALYDAKLLLAAGRKKKTMAKINEALDITQKWTTVTVVSIG